MKCFWVLERLERSESFMRIVVAPGASNGISIVMRVRQHDSIDHRALGQNHIIQYKMTVKLFLHHYTCRCKGSDLGSNLTFSSNWVPSNISFQCRVGLGSIIPSRPWVDQYWIDTREFENDIFGSISSMKKQVYSIIIFFQFATASLHLLHIGCFRDPCFKCMHDNPEDLRYLFL